MPSLLDVDDDDVAGDGHFSPEAIIRVMPATVRHAFLVVRGAAPASRKTYTDGVALLNVAGDGPSVPKPRPVRKSTGDRRAQTRSYVVPSAVRVDGVALRK